MLLLWLGKEEEMRLVNPSFYKQCDNGTDEQCLIECSPGLNLELTEFSK